MNLELLPLCIMDLPIRDGLLVDLLKAVQLLGCCLPQLHGMHSLLKIHIKQEEFISLNKVQISTRCVRLTEREEKYLR